MPAVAARESALRHFNQRYSTVIGSVGRVRVGLDLGTANTLIYVHGQGFAINEPTLVTVRASTGEIEAAGTEAEAGLGRTPRKFRTVKPIRRGIISDLRICEGMLHRFLTKTGRNLRFRGLQVAAAVPGELTEVERLAVLESLRNTRAKEVLLTDQVLAAAQGAGLPIEEPQGRMVVDIGAGITDIAVISLANRVHGRTIPVAGDEMDVAVAAHVRGQHQLLIGERTAERIKIQVGSALPGPEARSMKVKGRCLIDGIPREVSLCDSEILDALSAPVHRIVIAIREVLEQAPPELSADLMETGILLTGGSALLRDLDKRISKECGLPVTIAPDPLLSVIAGLARQLKRLRRRDWRRFGHSS
jgi:rod shape-determining protein MreB